jgi:hypothetical protein
MHIHERKIGGVAMNEILLLTQFICVGFIALSWEREIECPRPKAEADIEKRKEAKSKSQCLPKNKVEQDEAISPAILEQESQMESQKS